MTTAKRREDLQLFHGGLMRCCVDSYEQWVAAAPRAFAQPGQYVQCVHEGKDTMRVTADGGAVIWIGERQDG